MTPKGLYEFYLMVHDSRELDGCKSSCGQLEICESFDRNGNTYTIYCGTYCIGPGRWEIVGEGKTLDVAIMKAHCTLSAFYHDSVVEKIML